MKPEVRVQGGKVIIRPKEDDAITKVRRLGLRNKVAAGGLTNEERDLVLLALLQDRGLL